MTIHFISTKRPKVLVNAARFGAKNYKRSRDLTRLLGLDYPKKDSDILSELWAMENYENEKRKNNGAPYEPRHHLNILIAILGEVENIAVQ